MSMILDDFFPDWKDCMSVGGSSGGSNGDDASGCIWAVVIFIVFFGFLRCNGYI